MKRQTKGNKQLLFGYAGRLFVCLFCVLYFGLAVEASQYREKDQTKEVYEYLLLDAGVDDLQQLIDQVYCQKASSGVTLEYIWALVETDPSLDYTGFGQALEKDLLSQESLKTASLQKACISFLKIGYVEKQEVSFIEEALSGTGTDSIMSDIYGIMLMKELRDLKAESKEEYQAKGLPEISDEVFLNAITSLCSLQLTDGGFAYQGKDGDVDVTAMALCALAECDKDSSKIGKTIERGVLFLQKAQCADGDFASMGNPNLESTAQVLICLHALSIDPLSQDFTSENGYSVIDGLRKYQLLSGAFCHALGGKENAMATSQALYALSLYESDRVEENKVLKGSSLTLFKEHYQMILSAVVVLLALFYMIYIAKKNRKKCILACAVSGIVLCLVWFVSLESVATHEAKVGKKQEVFDPVTVHISICCESVLDATPVQTNTDFAVVLPKDGFISKETEFTVEAGSSAFDATKLFCDQQGVFLDYQKDTMYGTYYVSGIANLYERDYGDLSGWMYRVNGEFKSVGCGEYELQDGDVLEWIYTKELGHDIE